MVTAPITCPDHQVGDAGPRLGRQAGLAAPGHGGRGHGAPLDACPSSFLFPKILKDGLETPHALTIEAKEE